MIAVRIVNGITEHLPYRLSEWACALILFFFGLTLLQAGDSFKNPAFAVLKVYAAEDTWGWVIVSIAGVRVTALLVNGTFKWSMRISLTVCAICASLCVGVWFALCLGVFLAEPSAPGSRTYAVLMAVDIFLAVYMSGKAGSGFRKPANGGA